MSSQDLPMRWADGCVEVMLDGETWTRRPADRRHPDTIREDADSERDIEYQVAAFVESPRVLTLTPKLQHELAVMLHEVDVGGVSFATGRHGFLEEGAAVSLAVKVMAFLQQAAQD